MGSVCPPVGRCLFIVASNRGFISGHRSAWPFHLCVAVQLYKPHSSWLSCRLQAQEALRQSCHPFFLFSLQSSSSRKAWPTHSSHSCDLLGRVDVDGKMLGWGGGEDLSCQSFCSDPVLACRVGIGVRGRGSCCRFGELKAHPTPLLPVMFSLVSQRPGKCSPGGSSVTADDEVLTSFCFALSWTHGKRHCVSFVLYECVLI